LTALAEATKSGAINNISWTGRWVEPNTAFASRNVGMYMAPNSALFWAASKADWINDENVEVVDAPGDWWTPNHHGWGVSASTEHPDAAVDLIKIATSDKWQETMSSTFSILTLNKNVDPMLIEKFKTEDPLKAKILTAAGSKLDMITGYLKSPVEARVKDAFWTSVQPALLGQVDPQKALDSAEAKVNRVLSRR
jgi:ABC-type glycerol-3-phosphate transport system substrate-binding protein